MPVKHFKICNISICYFKNIPNNKNMDKATLRNLKDANCNRNLISKFFLFEKNGKTMEQLRLLAVHRKNLLDKLHKSQERIDCLDYLIFKIKEKQ